MLLHQPCCYANLDVTVLLSTNTGENVEHWNKSNQLTSAELTSASISTCLFSSSLATTMALCLPERLQHTAHSQSKVTTASSSGDICTQAAFFIRLSQAVVALTQEQHPYFFYQSVKTESPILTSWPSLLWPEPNIRLYRESSELLKSDFSKLWLSKTSRVCSTLPMVNPANGATMI